MKTFYYTLKSGREWNLEDAYLLQHTNENETLFHVYDANLMPSSNFETWCKEAIKEVESYVRKRFKGYKGIIKIDNYVIDMKGD